MYVIHNRRAMNKIMHVMSITKTKSTYTTYFIEIVRGGLSVSKLRKSRAIRELEKVQFAMILTV